MSAEASHPKGGNVRRVMVVEDSMIARRILTDVLNEHPGLSVDWTATDGIDCLEQLKVVRPDVVTLDVEMPNLDGMKTLEEILRIHAVPVVMISSHTRQGAQTTVRALELGAIDFVAKPEGDPTTGLVKLAAEITQKVLSAAEVDMYKFRRMYQVLNLTRLPKRIKRRVVALGASTGGPRTLQLILKCFPSDFPVAFLVAQHMPSGFTKELAGRLNSTCRLTVSEAQDGDLITPGRVLVAPGGDIDMIVERSPIDASAVVRLVPNVTEMQPAPSIDRLMSSVAEAFPDEAIGVLLTGMGTDGAAGLERMKAAGNLTIAESEASCVIFGMPKKAIELGAVSVVAAKEEIAEAITSRVGH